MAWHGKGTTWGARDPDVVSGVATNRNTDQVFHVRSAYALYLKKKIEKVIS